MENTGNVLLSLWPWLLLLGLIYFMMIRPQQKREKERREMLSSLRVGDDVVTIGGLHGRITALRENIINLEIAEDLEVTFSKMAVAAKVDDEEVAESVTDPEPMEDMEDQDRS
ncbi:MAG: preprotein translocase subunit YajC [Bacillota bacterium]